MERRPFAMFVLAVVAATASCSGADAVLEREKSVVSVRPTSASSGRVSYWPEATTHLLVSVDEGGPRVEVHDGPATGFTAYWSIASTLGGGSAFFYSDALRGGEETRVSVAKDVRVVEEIQDATVFSESQMAVGPVVPGQIVLVRHLPTNRYLALVLEKVTALEPHDAGAGPYAYAEVTWYLGEPGAVSFAPPPLTEPEAPAEGGAEPGGRT